MTRPPQGEAEVRDLPVAHGGSRSPWLVASAQRASTLAADRERIWAVVEDPARLRDWWPEVARVEGVTEDRWTMVHVTKRGRTVRVDYRLLASQTPARRTWMQEVQGTPFERVLSEAITDIVLEPAIEGGTRATIAQRQKLRGYSRTGALMLRRPMARRLAQALDGLAALVS